MTIEEYLSNLKDLLAHELEKNFAAFGSINPETLETEWDIQKRIRGEGSKES